MKNKREKQIFIFFIATILVLSTLFNSIAVYAAESLPENYIIDNTGVLSNYEIDLIDNVGKELERNGVKLIAVFDTTAEDKDTNSIIKNEFFQWYGQIDSTETKLVVINYYVDENKLLVFDDGKNYISSQYMLKLQNNMQLYQDNDDITSGSYYLYSAVADEIADKLDVKLESSNSNCKYHKFILFQSLPALFAVLIVVILVFSFRKRRK
jgi:uncharacterized membrane protein YgcG